MENFIYKICTTNEWKSAEKAGVFKGSKKDLIDGYIHFSKKEQLNNTLKKYFINIDKLIILKVEVLNLKNLKWEKSQNEEKFPHLYSALNLKSVKCIFKLLLKENGTHKLPSNL